MNERTPSLSWSAYPAYLPRAGRYGVAAFVIALCVWPFSGHPLAPFALGAALWSVLVWLTSARMLQVEASSRRPKRMSALTACLVFALLLIVVIWLAVGP